MASLDRCPSCTGFVPQGIRACPNCGATEPVVDLVADSVVDSASAGDRIAFWLKAAGGSAVAMTLMACYGVPYDPNDPTDTDSTTGTGGTAGTAGDTAGSTTAQTDASSGSAEASTGAAESSTGAAETEGSTGGSDSTGGGAVDEPSLPR